MQQLQTSIEITNIPLKLTMFCTWKLKIWMCRYSVMDVSRWVLFKYVEIVDKIVEQQYMNKYYHSKN